MLKRCAWGCGASRGIHLPWPTPQGTVKTADWSWLKPRANAEPAFTNRMVSPAPANHNTHSHTCWQCNYHLRITAFFLLVISYFNFYKSSCNTAAVASPFDLCDASAHIDKKEGGTRDAVLIRKLAMSWLIRTEHPQIGCYNYTALEGKKNGKRWATAHRRRWKAQSLLCDPAPVLSQRKAGLSSSPSQTDLQMCAR